MDLPRFGFSAAAMSTSFHTHNIHGPRGPQDAPGLPAPAGPGCGDVPVTQVVPEARRNTAGKRGAQAGQQPPAPTADPVASVTIGGTTQGAAQR